MHWWLGAGSKDSAMREHLLSRVVKLWSNEDRAKWFGFCLLPQFYHSFTTGRCEIDQMPASSKAKLTDPVF